MTGAAEESGGHGFQAAGHSGFAEEAVLHEAGGRARGCVVDIDADELFEIGEHEPEGPARAKIGEDVS